MQNKQFSCNIQLALLHTTNDCLALSSRLFRVLFAIIVSVSVKLNYFCSMARKSCYCGMPHTHASTHTLADGYIWGWCTKWKLRSNSIKPLLLLPFYCCPKMTAFISSHKQFANVTGHCLVCVSLNLFHITHITHIRMSLLTHSEHILRAIAIFQSHYCHPLTASTQKLVIS